MQTPRLGNLVEIWEPVPGSLHGLELHLVFCTQNLTQSGSQTFRGIHFVSGGIHSFQRERINKILRGDEYLVGWVEFKKKTKKGNRHGY